MVDMVFLQDQYCHFRQAIYDVIKFCKLPEKPCNPHKILGNLQVNAFGMITQVSQVVTSFTSQPWNNMDRDTRGYTLH